MRIFKPKYLTAQDTYNAIKKTIAWLSANKPKLVSGMNKLKLAKWTLAIFKHESGNFNIYAKNRVSTASGLPQVLEATRGHIEKKFLELNYSTFNPDKAKAIQEPHEAMYDPEYACIVGIAYFAYNVKRYKDFERGTFAYNQGNFNKSKGGYSYLNTIKKAYNNLDYADLEKNSDVAMDVSIASDDNDIDIASIDFDETSKRVAWK